MPNLKSSAQHGAQSGLTHDTNNSMIIDLDSQSTDNSAGISNPKTAPSVDVLSRTKVRGIDILNQDKPCTSSSLEVRSPAKRGRKAKIVTTNSIELIDETADSAAKRKRVTFDLDRSIIKNTDCSPIKFSRDVTETITSSNFNQHVLNHLERLQDQMNSLFKSPNIKSPEQLGLMIEPPHVGFNSSFETTLNDVPIPIDSPKPIKKAKNIGKINPRSEMDRLIKNLPKFKGEENENFSSWVLNTKLGLDMSSCSDSEKVKIVLFKVEGYPREILNNMNNIDTVDRIFETLQATYGTDQRSILSSIKQLPDESVKVFSTRLKINLTLLGIHPNGDNQSSLIRLDYFLKGLNASISPRVRTLLPDTYEMAERYALQIEAENNNHQEKDVKKSKKNFDSINTIKINTDNNQSKIEDTLNVILNKLNDHDNAHKSIKDKVSSIMDSEHWTLNSLKF